MEIETSTETVVAGTGWPLGRRTGGRTSSSLLCGQRVPSSTSTRRHACVYAQAQAHNAARIELHLSARAPGQALRAVIERARACTVRGGIQARARVFGRVFGRVLVCAAFEDVCERARACRAVRGRARACASVCGRVRACAGVRWHLGACAGARGRAGACENMRGACPGIFCRVRACAECVAVCRPIRACSTRAVCRKEPREVGASRGAVRARRTGGETSRSTPSAASARGCCCGSGDTRPETPPRPSVRSNLRSAGARLSAARARSSSPQPSSATISRQPEMHETPA
eukprot:4100796-Pleurochrysis_carterae.AAC.1